MHIQPNLTASDVLSVVTRFLDLALAKHWSLYGSWNAERGSPVFTVADRCTIRVWTDWTPGFHIGATLLYFEVAGAAQFLELGHSKTVRHMAAHISHCSTHTGRAAF